MLSVPWLLSKDGCEGAGEAPGTRLPPAVSSEVVWVSVWRVLAGPCLCPLLNNNQTSARPMSVFHPPTLPRDPVDCP